MKRLMALVLLLIVSLTVCINLAGCSAFKVGEGSEDGLLYALFADDTVVITGYEGTETELIIPARLNGYRVRSINNAAFIGNQTLKRVVITGDVTVGELNYRLDYGVYGGVFENCTALETVILSKGVTEVEGGAFKGCTALKTVYLSPTIRKGTGYGAVWFSGCTALENIIIEDGVRGLCADDFTDTLYYNTESNWDNDMLYIGNHLIAARPTVEGSCSVRDNTVAIAGGAFAGCDKMTTISVPESVQWFGSAGFSGCTALENIIIGDGVTGFCAYDFEDTLYYNTESNWDNGVLYIGNHLISAKTTIEGSYCVRESTVTIAEHAFSGCDKMTNIFIPKSVKWIGDDAFLNCEMLEDKPKTGYV